MTYDLEYDGIDIARVEIDNSETSTKAIKEMVEFWSGWERKIAQNNGNYVACWLVDLALYILRYGEPPEEQEGWYRLDGSYGIKVIEYWPYEFDIQDIRIKLA